MSTRRYVNLRLLLEKRGLKHQEVAKMIGMTPAKFSQKINRNKSDFTLAEASLICDVLNVSMDEYFFVHDVSKMRR
ncbi:helix-turn-helix domain-containing protein [Staphylococcus chromogenes]|nr:helix-turn-helix transcriptional regulator [Staphylococcus chromogenes]MBP0044992.1 helix-turn-helix transcriptional regulator [Staphylococcus chromogenes]MDT0679677.1 helix-turn-helix transcriptional regulator [Staphylococcus chromogenes]MDT0747168.1 helix-turn-helix transcriptional regulator [Staphylococcus chromogenes]MDU0452300.1 helix-turn-helix transcriptional regulator [Staphylococcus chromogenes]PNY96915.1 XRE family transcriptional regulator [Staphylococcus chromogenes]